SSKPQSVNAPITPPAAMENPVIPSDKDTTVTEPGMTAPQEGTYVCAKGDYQSKEPTVCPTHKQELLREGTYFCPSDDGVFSNRPSKCPKCGRDLEQVEVKE